MTVLPSELRTELERTVVTARDVAEEGSQVALKSLAVDHYEPYDHMDEAARQLRRHLRARGRQLGDQLQGRTQQLDHLVQECAFEHWHRMLFARFLAENELLVHPDLGIPISLAECEELAAAEGTDQWTLASRYAQDMLPQIFRPDDPLLQVQLAPEHQQALEQLLDGLAPETFRASDALGWVYQFWQSERKDQVNASGVKIGADELPAVTQLFTEPYMVRFLIHNTLGAWYAGRVLNDRPELARDAGSEEELRQALRLPGVTWDYLRFIQSDDGVWEPAAGTFDGWPNQAGDLKILDPATGSGHFLVSVLQHLAPIRMEEEGLTPRGACDAVLAENIHGLEIDPRCTQIAAFALAMAAWTYPRAGGYRELPGLQVACSGLAPNAKKEEWLELAGDDQRLRTGMSRLYDLFQDAPALGSLIEPRQGKEDLLSVPYTELAPLLRKALELEESSYSRREMGISARGMAQAAALLSDAFHLLLTNVPYLYRGKQDEVLQQYCEAAYPDAKTDLATVFVSRTLHLLDIDGTTAVIMPQNWLYLTSYEDMRRRLLAENRWRLLARIGPRAFDSISGEVVNVCAFVLGGRHSPDAMLAGIDVYEERAPSDKERGLRTATVEVVTQAAQLGNPDARILFSKRFASELLSDYVESLQGIATGDYPHYGAFYWEVSPISAQWTYQQSTVDLTVPYGGREHVLFWQGGCGDLAESPRARIQGQDGWGRNGVAVRQMGSLAATLHTGHLWDNNTGVIIPNDQNHLPALWCFCSSPKYAELVRSIDKKLNVTNATLAKVPFDLDYWTQVAEEKYPNGLPEPYSDDSTQWLFHGHPVPSTVPLQVAVARLLGYKWPAELDPDMDLSSEGRRWVDEAAKLNVLADLDGIVPIAPVRGEEAAADRLRAVLAAAYGAEWSLHQETRLIAESGSKAGDLEAWLRGDFFRDHCKLFHHRPFVWHIWDGRPRDGFHVLANYHKLVEGDGNGRQLLENLTYSYLGDWINRQKDGVSRGLDGAEGRLEAAQELKTRLEAILEGEPPFDIFVRWKPLHEQPIGWEPDINDGVLLNIRPFMASDIPGGRKGAGVLRHKPNCRWTNDRGKDPVRPEEDFPWMWSDGEFTGKRVNNIHLTVAEKQRARARRK